MSGRRALAGSLLALLMPASMILVTQTSSSSADTNDSISTSVSERRAKTRVKLEALPQIVAQGKRPASANAAKAGFTATVKPGKPGRTVALQVQKGSKWKTVKKTKLNKKGRAEFGAPISRAALLVSSGLLDRLPRAALLDLQRDGATGLARLDGGREAGLGRVGRGGFCPGRRSGAGPPA